MVTGTGTGVGKTVVTAAVAALAPSCTVVKPAQTGVPDGGPGDLAEVTRLAGPVRTVELARYPDPLSPEAAARVSGRRPLTTTQIVSSVGALADAQVVVEGAGGLLVRFGPDGSTLADVAAGLGAPVLVVVAAGLGTLNATGLTLEALRSRGLTVAGLVIGAWPAEPDLAMRCNLTDLQAMASLLGALPDGAARLGPAAFRDVARRSLAPALGGVFDADAFARQVTGRPSAAAGAGAPSLVDRDRAVVWHPYASVVEPAPLFGVAGAAGTRIVLDDGRELVDGMSSWWAAIHGYRHPVLDSAVRAQVDRFAHVMFGGLTHEPAVGLAERLVGMTPDPLTRVFFSDSGSVAVEVALKLALQYWHGRGQPQRRTMLTVLGGYHGDTAGAMSVCDPHSGMHSMFRGHVAQQVFVPRPRPRFHEPCDDRDLDDVERMLEQRNDLAAVVIEPVVQGAGGMWFYSPQYLRHLVELCRSHGLLVVFDEIATGFGRTGALFALEHAGVVPDVLCLGKALTGGYLTLGATLCTGQVAEAVCAAPGGAFMHGPTFMANPLATAVATANLDLLRSGDWAAQVARISDRLEEGLAPLRGAAGVADVRVLGAIGVVELQEPVDIRELQPRLVDEGVWLRPFGRLLYTMPPYISTDDDVDTLTRAMVRVCTG